MPCGKAGNEEGHGDHLCLSCNRHGKYNGVCVEVCRDNGECLFEPMEDEFSLAIRRVAREMREGR